MFEVVCDLWVGHCVTRTEFESTPRPRRQAWELDQNKLKHVQSRYNATAHKAYVWLTWCVGQIRVYQLRVWRFSFFLLQLIRHQDTLIRGQEWNSQLIYSKFPNGAQSGAGSSKTPQAESKNNSFDTNWPWLNSKFLSAYRAPCAVFKRKARNWLHELASERWEKVTCFWKEKIFSFRTQNKVRRTWLALLPAPDHTNNLYNVNNRDISICCTTWLWMRTTAGQKLN